MSWTGFIWGWLSFKPTNSPQAMLLVHQKRFLPCLPFGQCVQKVACWGIPKPLHPRARRPDVKPPLASAARSCGTLKTHGHVKGINVKPVPGMVCQTFKTARVTAAAGPSLYHQMQCRECGLHWILPWPGRAFLLLPCGSPDTVFSSRRPRWHIRFAGF